MLAISIVKLSLFTEPDIKANIGVNANNEAADKAKVLLLGNRIRDKRYVTYTVTVLINTESIRMILIANAVPDHTKT